MAAAVPAVERAPLNPLETRVVSFRAQSARAFDSSCKFVFKNVFQGSAASAVESGKAAGVTVDRPLKVEVCSGAGEWVVARVSPLAKFTHFCYFLSEFSCRPLLIGVDPY